MASAIDVANWFLCEIDRDAGDSITHLKLQKLAYYAQAWSLALRNEPLFNEDFQAWAHGPVASSIYNVFKDKSWSALPAPKSAPKFGEEVEELLSDIFEVYGQYSAKKLEDMTHNEDPWVKARGDLPPEARSSAIIPKEHIATYYRQLYEESE